MAASSTTQTPKTQATTPFTLANGITMLRIALIPVFGALFVRGQHALALVVFALAGLSDLLDGLVARALHQQTRLGRILDPAADKLLLVVCFIATAARGVVPRWLAALVVARDLLLVVGAGLLALHLRRVHGRPPHAWKPTRIGKWSTATQVATIALALAQAMGDWPQLAPWVAALAIPCAVAASLAGIQYVAFGIASLCSRAVD
jgi:cardiolipin synthase